MLVVALESPADPNMLVSVFLADPKMALTSLALPPNGLEVLGLSPSLSLALSSAPGAKPLSSMKSDSFTFVGSPQMNPPLGGAGAGRGGGIRLGEGALRGTRRPDRGDPARAMAVIDRLGDGAISSTGRCAMGRVSEMGLCMGEAGRFMGDAGLCIGDAGRCIGEAGRTGCMAGDAALFSTAGAGGVAGGADEAAPDNMSKRDTGRDELDRLLNRIGRRGCGGRYLRAEPVIPPVVVTRSRVSRMLLAESRARCWDGSRRRRSTNRGWGD